MRAFIQWLALAPLLVLAGCGTFHRSPPSADSGTALSVADADRAEALAHYGQGLISEITLGEMSSSVSHFRQAAFLDPSHLPLSLKVAVECIGRKDYAGAVTLLNQAARYHPGSFEVQVLLGSVYQAQGNVKAALRAFRSSIRLSPDHPDGYVRLAALEVVRMRTGQALAVIDEGLARLKDPQPLLELCENVGRIFVAAKDAGDAIPFLQRVCQKTPGRDDLRELLARCFLAAGRTRDAGAEIGVLLRKSPDSSRVWLLSAEIHEQAGDRVGAEADIRRAMKGAPPEPVAPLRLAELQVGQDPERALQTLREAQTAFPDDLRIRVLLALLLVRLERYEEALTPFDEVARAMERDPLAARTIQPLFYFWYGGACERAGHISESEKWMEKYLSLNPKASEALNYLAYIWAEQGRNLDRGLDYITRALKTEPRNGAYLDTLGWIHFKKGNYPLALTYLNEALKADGKNDPAIMEHIGDTWFALKQRDKAIRMWTNCLRLDPANPSCRDKLIRENVNPRRLPPVPEKTTREPR